MSSTTETDAEPATFSETNSRREAMEGAIDDWLENLVDAAAEARTSDTFQRWLDAQAAFHDYSYRNSLLIERQCPGATKVAGYRTWQEEFDRHVEEGESAIWIWAPIITERCPACENSESYHAQNECDYDETPPAEWDRGLVGFKPVPVFDVSQTEGEPLPDLETAATGDPGDLVGRLLDAADPLELSVRVVPDDDWSHGDADGVCTRHDPVSVAPLVEVRDRDNRAALVQTLCHEYAHALLHVRSETVPTEATRELEAEAVAYVVGRHLGLDMSGSAFYLAAWQGDDASVIRDRLSRISQTAEAIIDVV
jgi:hypothetical protein